MDQRDFIREFRKRGLQALDKEEPFEAFIYLWLAFLQSCAPEGVRRIKSDRKDIIEPWNDHNSVSVTGLLDDPLLKDNFQWLAERNEGNILNPIGRHPKDITRLKLLSSYIKGNHNSDSNPHDVSYALLDLCLSVRNNLFHGGKSFYNHNDHRLLSNMCPILICLIEINMPYLRNE